MASYYDLCLLVGGWCWRVEARDKVIFSTKAIFGYEACNITFLSIQYPQCEQESVTLPGHAMS